MSFRLRSGTDDNTSNYRTSRLDQGSTSVTGSRNLNQTLWENVFIPTVFSHNVLELSNPFQTTHTSGSCVRVQAPNGDIAQTLFSTGISTSLSYDGFSLINLGGTITGTVLVYGYNLG
jgi:hypothetical protein